MPEFIAKGPIIGVIAFLFVIVLLRAQATYWIGRGVTTGWLRAHLKSGFGKKVQAWFNGPVPDRGKRALERYGLIIIPLCFLTVGFQTAVNAAAGVLRMRWLTYTLCMIPGCVAWALIYSFGGLSLWVLAWEMSMQNLPITIMIFAFFIMALTAWIGYRRRRRVNSTPEAAVALTERN